MDPVSDTNPDFMSNVKVLCLKCLKGNQMSFTYSTVSYQIQQSVFLRCYVSDY